MTARTEVIGRLVLDDRIFRGRIVMDGGVIEVVETEEHDGGPGEHLIAPGFVDVHVHGWGGHDAMAGPAALDGMARTLARRGVTSFLPTAVSAPLERLEAFADDVRRWAAVAPADGAAPLGFALEGPFLAAAHGGAHLPSLLRDPATVSPSELAPLLEGLRLITIAPERPGALELIASLSARGVRVALGHSDATVDQARAGYAAGATTTTHLFNGMSGLDHHSPGLAAAALLDDAAWVELIADDHHVHPDLWRLAVRVKPPGRVILVSDATWLAGMGDANGRVGAVEVEVIAGRATIAGTDTLAGSLIALDDAVRSFVASGVPLLNAVAAASRDPLAMLGVTDRGRIAAGQRADLVALDDDLHVRDVWLAGRRIGSD